MRTPAAKQQRDNTQNILRTHILKIIGKRQLSQEEKEIGKTIWAGNSEEKKYKWKDVIFNKHVERCLIPLVIMGGHSKTKQILFCVQMSKSF